MRHRQAAPLSAQSGPSQGSQMSHGEAAKPGAMRKCWLECTVAQSRGEGEAGVRNGADVGKGREGGGWHLLLANKATKGHAAPTQPSHYAACQRLSAVAVDVVSVLAVGGGDGPGASAHEGALAFAAHAHGSVEGHVGDAGGFRRVPDFRVGFEVVEELPRALVILDEGGVVGECGKAVGFLVAEGRVGLEERFGGGKRRRRRRRKRGGGGGRRWRRDNTAPRPSTCTGRRTGERMIGSSTTGSTNARSSHGLHCCGRSRLRRVLTRLGCS